MRPCGRAPLVRDSDRPGSTSAERGSRRFVACGQSGRLVLCRRGHGAFKHSRIRALRHGLSLVTANHWLRIFVTDYSIGPHGPSHWINCCKTRWIMPPHVTPHDTNSRVSKLFESRCCQRAGSAKSSRSRRVFGRCFQQRFARGSGRVVGPKEYMARGQAT